MGGAAGGTRTPDPLITNEVRYQLCHCGDTRAFYSRLWRFPTPFFAFLSIFSGILLGGGLGGDLLPQLLSMLLHPLEPVALEWPDVHLPRQVVGVEAVDDLHRRPSIAGWREHDDFVGGVQASAS